MVANHTRARQERALQLSGQPAEHGFGPADLPAALVTGVVVLGLLVTPLATLLDPLVADQPPATAWTTI